GAVMTFRSDRDGLLLDSRAPVPMLATVLGASVGVAAALSHLHGDQAASTPTAYDKSSGEKGSPKAADIAMQAWDRFRKGDYDAGLSLLDQAAAIDPKFAEVPHSRGYFLLARGKKNSDTSDFEKARVEFAAAEKLGFDAAVCRYNVACALALLGKKD